MPRRRQALSTAVLWGMSCVVAGVWLLGCGGSVSSNSATGPTGAAQAVQENEVCETCHARQYQETLQSVKSGYRAVSPLFNSLELASNMAVQGLLDAGAIRNNLRPVYATPSASGLPSGTNMISSVDGYGSNNDVRAAFCIGCHDSDIIQEGENLATREIPEWSAHLSAPNDMGFQAVVGARPLRDYHFIDPTTGQQMLPALPGGPPPPGSRHSLGAEGVLCDHCHNVQGPDLARTLQHDGYANMGHLLDHTRIKIGPFADALVVGPLPPTFNDPLFLDSNLNFHAASINPERIDFLRSSDFCAACHDVRVPSTDLVVTETDSDNPAVTYFRLENLSTEWATQAYAFAGENPFSEVVSCQDCHMSEFPFSGDKTYSVHDPASGKDFQVTSPLPGVYPMDKAASGANPTGEGLPLPTRQVVTHYFTGIDVPLLYTNCTTAQGPPYFRNFSQANPCVGELQERLGSDRPDTFEPGTDSHGIPLSLQTRREALARAATRTFLDLSDPNATLGETYHVRVSEIALTGHDFPSGFSQERTTWIKLTVSAPFATGGAICTDRQFVHTYGACTGSEYKDQTTLCLSDADCPTGSTCGGICADGLFTCNTDADCQAPRDTLGETVDPCLHAQSQFCTQDGQFILYQSGYLIDKAHPETGEMAPDGNLNDEDLENLHAVVNPFTANNEIFEEGPDDGPVARIFEGEHQGLVLFRNELTRIYGPACVPATMGQTNSGSCPSGMVPTNIPATNRNDPRTGQPLTAIVEEETFAAGLANTVDNSRALPPLQPKTFDYDVQLPSAAELAQLGITLESPIRVRAAVEFQHFPPVFLRYLVRASGAVPYETPPYGLPGSVIPLPQVAPLNAKYVGHRGPGDIDFHTIDEKRIDDLMKIMRDISADEITVPLTQAATAPSTQGERQ